MDSRPIHSPCWSSINSWSSRGGRGILASLRFPFKSDLLCREGRQHLHPLSCWKDKPKECLKANCVLRTLLAGCLSDKLCLCSPWWSYVCQYIWPLWLHIKTDWFEGEGRRDRRCLKGPYGCRSLADKPRGLTSRLLWQLDSCWGVA